MRIALAFCCALLAAGPAAAEPGARPAPVKALYVTGGGFHDYEKLTPMLTAGMAKHAPVEFTVKWGLDVLRDRGFAADYDVVVYNMCFAREENAEIIGNALRTIREGKPAVMVHCALHSFMASDDWTACCGLRTRRHDRYRSFDITPADARHPVVRFWPEKWTTPGDELYQEIAFGEDAHALLHAWSVESEKNHVVAWTNRCGMGRVFATTLGHDDKTAGQDLYHRLLANGLLWAVQRLDDHDPD